METKFNDSKVNIGDEQWTVKYYDRVFHPRTGAYCKAARVPSKKEIWLSLEDEEGNSIANETVVNNFQKAVAPLFVEAKKREVGEERLKEELRSIGLNI